MKQALWVCGLLLAVSAVGAAVHHSFAAMYDSRRVGTIHGVVTKVAWGAPHPYIYLDVENQNGQKANWFVEGSNIHVLAIAGWSSTTVKPGDTITVCGYLGKPNVSPAGYPPDVVSDRAMAGQMITLADGRTLPFLNEKISCP